MDGSVTVLDADSGAVLAGSRPHTKYVVRACFDPLAGGVIATASFDQSCCLLRLVAGAAGGLELQLMRQVQYGAAVQDVAFLPPPRSALAPAAAAATPAGGGCSGAGEGEGASRVLVAVREAGCLWSLDAGSGEDLPHIPLHGRDDDHLKISPMRLALSPCGRYLLVALDGPRLLVLRTADWSRLRAIYGLNVPQYHNHAVAWHHDAAYVYASAENASVHVYHVGTGKLAARLEGRHRVNVRDLNVDWGRNLLATCSFDKSVKVFGCQQ
ncbi:hypothetical protein MNEG_4639 [Monoraphidium neglectum]|uniref:Uncharacterized protein n=1 Tax=Monoraphidium neglectum TaxID=145388 RepID=A0A0D2JXG4_9CHLO|nr:hypothetical protein MNEG_4639 [Monoraphidium neglectum]KIZ03323.1 hypothetical protein MNEG_4639 [Monoraphidium neglectum]|eukprot:XP_013902342.1 hypothetical protein MNEG_4639 [Monoraphidium neglectum]